MSQVDVLPELDDGEDKPGEERVLSIVCKVGPVDQFLEEIFGVRLEKKEDGSYPIFPRGLYLGVQKFRHYGRKIYRLVWVGRGVVWLAAENTENHRRLRDALGAGYQVAAETGAYFSEWSR